MTLKKAIFNQLLLLYLFNIQNTQPFMVEAGKRCTSLTYPNLSTYCSFVLGGGTLLLLFQLP